MSYVKWSYDTLHHFLVDAFVNFGFEAAQAETISENLLMSDLYGIESHGMQRVVRYHKGIEKGMIDVHATPEVVLKRP